MTPSPSADSRPSIWILDDSPTETEYIRAALARTCIITSFTDGESLLEALGQQPLPDTLVLDWELPGLSGIEVCQYLRNNRATETLPVLLLTVHHGLEDVVKGLEAGANDYVFKPFRPLELVARVHALVRREWVRKRALADERARRVLAEDSLTAVQEAEERAWRAEAERSELLAREREARQEVETLALALRESEERLRSALQAANIGTWSVDLKTGLDTRDAGANRILGLEAVETRQPLEDFFSRIHSEDRQRVQAAIQRAIHEHRGFVEEYRLLLPDAGTRWVRDQGRVLLDAQGQPTHFTGAMVDVTEQKRLEEETRQSAEFERQLIGIVSHDLRNPLSAITLTVSALKRQAFDERQQQRIHLILLAAERATRMIRDLLDFTQARQGGGIRVQRKATDLHEVARTVVDEAQLSRPDRIIQISQTGRGEGEWDSDRLAQVISNLLGNALQYSPPETPVRVETRGEEDAVVLEVHNRGAPISPELLPRIFEPLERGTAIVDQEKGSIGLGLYIVRHIVLAHGGTVNVRSTATEGTVFTVRLPRSPPAAHP
ncbi:ATP-binding protein [Hyalangium rubrum]|uniref:histidine kinase n=1 Tax=Hyalangium rubrum TaxID=3103134 RepID=A0ABU5GW86_9BACT|nr:ATP-binding protein [Hyalangium sp. s54d21]MDY7225456.1 response regulator [Hyalangium sp. s54d21]